jgi:hypothetical protein
MLNGQFFCFSQIGDKDKFYRSTNQFLAYIIHYTRPMMTCCANVVPNMCASEWTWPRFRCVTNLVWGVHSTGVMVQKQVDIPPDFPLAFFDGSQLADELNLQDLQQ